MCRWTSNRFISILISVLKVNTNVGIFVKQTCNTRFDNTSQSNENEMSFHSPYYVEPIRYNTESKKNKKNTQRPLSRTQKKYVGFVLLLGSVERGFVVLVDVVVVVVSVTYC